MVLVAAPPFLPLSSLPLTVFERFGQAGIFLNEVHHLRHLLEFVTVVLLGNFSKGFPIHSYRDNYAKRECQTRQLIQRATHIGMGPPKCKDKIKEHVKAKGKKVIALKHLSNAD